MSIHADDNDEGLDAESQEELHVLVATTCGHLFHQSCLIKACDSKRAHQYEIGLSITEKDFCPSCDREIEMDDCRRIFPTELPDDLGIASLSIGNEQELFQKIEELTGEVNRLKAKTSFQEMKIAELKKGRNTDRLPPTSSGSATRSDYLQVQSQLQGYGYQEIPDGSSEVSLRRGDAVVWVTDENYSGNSGIVRWLGRINNVIYAGIEFDDALGEDFHQSNGTILFETQYANTGRLVRVQELMLYKDFHGHEYYPPEPY